MTDTAPCGTVLASCECSLDTDHDGHHSCGGCPCEWLITDGHLDVKTWPGGAPGTVDPIDRILALFGFSDDDDELSIWP
jgi:hypothetical protein